MPVTTDVKRVHIARLRPNGDLVKELHAFLESRKVRFGMVSIIGALAKATLGSYSFDEASYHKFDIPHEIEILHCTGNVSLLEGRPFAHLHATVAGRDGRALGGHVFPGCRIKVAECIVLEFGGEALAREEDRETGLKLWKAES